MLRISVPIFAIAGKSLGVDYRQTRMQHRGEIIRKAVTESGISITTLAKRLNKSRRTIYNLFDSNNVSLEVILEIGRIIHHDFSSQIKELKRYGGPLDLQNVQDDEKKYNAEYWKAKYYELLEKHNALLEKEASVRQGSKSRSKK